MKVRYSFSSRKTKRATKSPKMRKQKEKYPEIIKRIILESDIILEILDARFIEKTRNKEIEKKIKGLNKKIIYVLNKSDLIRRIDKKELSKVKPNLTISCKTRKNIRKVRDLIKREVKKIKKVDKRKPSINELMETPRAIRVGRAKRGLGGQKIARKILRSAPVIVGIIGYPNTGKSSLINLLIGKSKAGTGADAGFTKGVQKLKLEQDIILLDTPGVIPKEEYSNVKSKKIAQHTIVGSRSYSQVKDPEMVISRLVKEYPKVLENHYKTRLKPDAEKILGELGKRWNYLEQGGKVNFDKTARKILKDWQTGVIKI
ncbi:hypothetical protein CMI44_01055 [Candidatus Pacearchaeota archaeon]|nr:hypothetical protein [Candidatus Pacearchaeota archaeon]